MALHTYKYKIRLGRTWHLAGAPDQAHVFRESTVSRRWRAEFFQLPSGCDGRVLCTALPKALQLQQSSALGGHRGCCACASRPRDRDRSGRGTARLASPHVLPQCVSSPHEPAPWVESLMVRSRPAPLRRLAEGGAALRPSGRRLSL